MPHLDHALDVVPAHSTVQDRAAPLPAGADVASRMDAMPVTRLHLAATALCGCGLSLDLMEMGLGNVLSAVFSLPPWSASSQDLAWLLASVYMGAAIGAPLIGSWGDRYGRRVVLVLAMAWLAVTSALAAASADATQLSIARALGGLALGAYPPLMMAYLTDILPPARRGMLIFLTIAVGAIGPPAGIFLVRALSPDLLWGVAAWRWAFVAGALGSVLIAPLFLLLPESPRWLRARGRQDDAAAAYARFAASTHVFGAAAAPDGPAPAPPAAAAVRGEGLPIVSLLYFLSPWSTIAFPLLIGAVLVNKGFRLQDTLLFVGVSTFGLLMGSLLSAGFIDRIQRRVTLAACAVGMAVCGMVFAMSESANWLVAAATLFILCGTLYLPTLTVYGSEIFPTPKRARFSAIAWACNRVGAALAPFLLLPLLHRLGAVAMTAAICLTLAASLAVLWCCPAGYAGKAVR